MNSKLIDGSVDHIIKKVLINNKKSKDNSQAVINRYSDQVYENSRILNCQLQDKNLELTKQFKKLEKILNVKLKVRQKLDKTDREINQIREKLKAVLNLSQSLQLSLIKFRGINRSKSSLEDSYEKQCCCSRRTKQRKFQKSYNNKKKNIQQNKTSVYKIYTANSLSSAQKISHALSKLPNITISIQIQCDLPYLEPKLQQIATKKQHIQKLKLLIDSQNKMLKKYEQNLYAQSNYGKITKASDIKQSKINSYIKTSASVGSIIKANRYVK